MKSTAPKPTPATQPLRVAILNASGNTGKSAMSRHLLRPSKEARSLALARALERRRARQRAWEMRGAIDAISPATKEPAASAEAARLQAVRRNLV